MRQSTDDLELQLRELFERQAVGLTASTLVDPDAPIVTEDEVTPRRRSRSAFVAVASVAAAVLVVVGIVGAAPTRDAVRVGGTPGSTVPVHFQTQQVRFDASSLEIEANGQTFTAAGTVVSVRSDPGNATYQTLELDWHEHGVEMRLYLYFAADAHDWWVSNLTTYNGRSQPDSIEYRGPLFRTPLGSAFAGDVDLAPTIGHGHVRLTGLHLRPFLPPAACANPRSEYALDISYPRVDMGPGTAGFGLGEPRLLDTATCTPVSDPLAYALDARVLDPRIAGLANYTLSPPVAAHRTFALGDSIDLAPKAAGTTILRVAAYRRADRAMIAVADVPIKVG